MPEQMPAKIGEGPAFLPWARPRAHNMALSAYDARPDIIALNRRMEACVADALESYYVRPHGEP